MPSARLLLIRHAESEWNASGRWQGQADPPLSSRGRRQAEQLVRRLASEPFDVLVTSDLSRAWRTAEALGRAHGLVPQRDPRLRELDVGDWAGLTRGQIVELDAPLLTRFESGDPDARPGGGESRREIRTRVRTAVSELAARHVGRCVAVVTHLGVIRVLRPGAEIDNAEWCVFDAAPFG